jgi:hypothetical protein
MRTKLTQIKIITSYNCKDLQDEINSWIIDNNIINPRINIQGVYDKAYNSIQHTATITYHILHQVKVKPWTGQHTKVKHRYYNGKPT